jgi:hypothetical protein
MAKKKTSHVILRDGSDSRGGPPPRIPERPSKPKEHPPPPKAFGAPYSTETSVVGKTEIDKKTFDEIRSPNSVVRHEVKPKKSGQLFPNQPGIVD